MISILIDHPWDVVVSLEYVGLKNGSLFENYEKHKMKALIHEIKSCCSTLTKMLNQFDLDENYVLDEDKIDIGCLKIKQACTNQKSNQYGYITHTEKQLLIIFSKAFQ